MEQLKIYNPLLVIRPGEKIPAGLGKDIGLALEVDFSSDEWSKDEMEPLINGSRPFILLINRHSHLMNEHELGFILLCFFSKKYIQYAGSPVIAYYSRHTGTETDAQDQFPEYLGRKLELQGWPSVVHWRFSGADVREQLEKKTHTALLIGEIDFDGSFLLNQLFSDFSRIDNYILFRRPVLREAMRAEQLFHSMCHAVLAGNPLLRSGLEEHLLANRTIGELNRKNLLLQERLDNAEKTIGVIRSKYKEDYEQLFEWYHHEYEMLPLWYKQFGHLLKVLTGKRTFKSLFYDHVKKYRT